MAMPSTVAVLTSTAMAGRRVFAAQDVASIAAEQSIRIRIAGAVAHEPTKHNVLTEW